MTITHIRWETPTVSVNNAVSGSRYSATQAYANNKMTHNRVTR